jgi:hypothetical protein
MQKPINITLDTITKRTVTNYSNIRRGDTLLMTITMQQNGLELDITNQKIHLILTKADNTVIDIETAGIGKSVTIELDEQATMCLGTVKGEVELSDNIGVSISNQFVYLVDESLGTNVVKKSIDQIKTLLDINNSLYDYSAIANTLKSDLENVIEIADTSKNNVDNSNATAETNIAELTELNNTANTLKTGLDNDIASGTALKNTLESDIATGTTLKDTLESDITGGTTLKNTLENDITTGTTLKNTLESDITTGTTLKNNLETDIATANTSRTNLDKSIADANAFAATYSGMAQDQVNIVNLNYVKDAAAELVRDSIPSGFSQMNDLVTDLDFNTMATTPNTIKTLKDMVAYVNGYKIKIPAATVITLDAPPTTGTRDDLVFLECWKQTDASGAITWNWRLRVVDNIDFSKVWYQGNYGSEKWIGLDSNGGTFANIIAQGGLSAPYANPIWPYAFRNNYGNTASANPTTNDVGLWIAGQNTTNYMTSLNTTDGYVYAIPLFRVHRRNSGGYSVSNGNGGGKLYTVSSRVPTTGYFVIGNSYDFNVSDTTGLVAGNVIANTSPNVTLKVNSVANSTTFNATVLSYKTATDYLLAGNFIWDISRQDKLSAYIIYERDIIDLRHQVSLTGFNYNQLLEENFDKLLRGELQTSQKTQMLKTYHGLAKTPTDANTVFYASLDGTTVAEVGGAPTLTLGTPSNVLMPTGLGQKGCGLKYPITIPTNITIDMWYIIPPTGTQGIWKQLFWFDSNNYALFDGKFITGYLTGKILSIVPNNLTPMMSHLRFTYNQSSNTIAMYLNGKLVNSATLDNTKLPTASSFYIGTENDTDTARYIATGLADFSISNIDRGTTFATLPQDYIDGYARLAPSFNEQRNVYSDALTSETDVVQIKANGGNGKAITTTQATAGQWTTGDTVKVKGLGGELIAGVIDSDTALATVTSLISGAGTTTTTLQLNAVTSITVGDIFRIQYNEGTNSSTIWTVSSIDTATNQVTFTTNTSSSGVTGVYTGALIFETTASSSAPTVKATATGTATAGAASTITLPSTFNATDGAYNGLTITITSGTGAGQVRTISGYVGSTKVATVSTAWTTTPDATSVFAISGVSVAGTWSGLGTNQATFTLGTLYALNTQDIWITYSLNEVAGQGGISEVLTTTLAGESNGKKLAVNPTVHIRDDFSGKVSGSLVENPNLSKMGGSTSLLSPSVLIANGYESSQSGYSTLMTLNNLSTTNATSTNGYLSQHLFSFNLIRIVEDKFGLIPAGDTAGKVAWLKANINKITCNWWGYGSCPSGNKANIQTWYNDTNSWASIQTHTLSTVSQLGFASTSVGNKIDNNGFYHVLASTDASDGVTASTIYSDYCNIELILNTPTGYDVLAPENPRRDDATTITTADLTNTSDFTGKVSGSTVVNPNLFKRNQGSALLSPSAFTTENDQSMYDNVATLNGVTHSYSSSVSGNIVQQLFSFNLIRIIEDKYGTIPGATDTASKILWLKNNLSKIVCNWWGYGSSASGNLANLAVINSDLTTWGTPATNTAATPTQISFNITTFYRIDANGFLHFLAYSPASDGVTASTIFTDYVRLDVVLSDTAIPQIKSINAKRGQGNMLLVQKETKTIQTMFSRGNADGVVTYGDWLPYQGLGTTITSTDTTLSIKAKNKNFISDVGTGGYKSSLSGIKENQLPTGINRSYYMNSNNIGYFKLEDFNNLINSNNDLLNPFIELLRTYNSNIYSELFNYSGTKKLRGFTPSQGVARNTDISNILSRFGLSTNSYVATGLIIAHQGNIYLVIARTDVNSDKTIWLGQTSTNAAIDVFYMPGRLLTK